MPQSLHPLHNQSSVLTEPQQIHPWDKSRELITAWNDNMWASTQQSKEQKMIPGLVQKYPKQQIRIHGWDTKFDRNEQDAEPGK